MPKIYRLLARFDPQGRIWLRRAVQSVTRLSCDQPTRRLRYFYPQGRNRLQRAAKTQMLTKVYLRTGCSERYKLPLSSKANFIKSSSVFYTEKRPVPREPAACYLSPDLRAICRMAISLLVSTRFPAASSPASARSISFERSCAILPSRQFWSV